MYKGKSYDSYPSWACPFFVHALTFRAECINALIFHCRKSKSNFISMQRKALVIVSNLAVFSSIYGVKV
jgi:hypothetical protein